MICQSDTDHLSPDARAMHTLIMEQLAARNATMTTRYVTRWPNIRSLPMPIILGSNSWFCPLTRSRIVYLPGAVEVAPGQWETPGTLARLYLQNAYGVTRPGYRYRMTNEQWSIMDEWPAMPSYARPQEFSDGYYIDIRSAWFQILTVGGWNIDYRPGTQRPRWIMGGRPPHDWPWPAAKAARSALVSLSRKATLRRWICPDCDGHAAPGCIHQGTPHFTSHATARGTRHPYFNPMLWRWVSDVLNSVASMALDAIPNLAYVNNDGYICPDAPSARALCDLLQRWRLMYRVKAQGPGWVVGRGSFQVGPLQTKSKNRPHELDRINRLPYPDWLQQRYAAMVPHRQAELGVALWRSLFP